MEQTLKASAREDTGKGAARKIRAAGQVPAVLYGHGMDALSLTVDSRDLFHVLHTDAGANVLINLEVGTDQHLAMPREVQRNHIRGEFIHIDFLAVRRDENITVDVPVSLLGEARGVKEGGLVEHHMWDVKVECFPGNVPESIEFDVSDLVIGDAVHASDLKMPEGVTLLTEGDTLIAAVVPPPVLSVEEEIEAVEGAEAQVEAEGATGDEATEHVEGEGG